ncbi:prepilin peptidase [Candidatus Woesearchaeota archaeon]|nr:prepilin peptidase [Candidatus Woesearchaeota archaeon]
MIELLIKHVISGIYLLTGSISDLKTREIADWANYGLIAFALAANLTFSLVHHDPMYIMNSLFGLAIFIVLALAMFYTGQWGGGDAKLLMGLGALYGFNIDSLFLVGFLINTLIAGAVYGLIWSIVLAFKNRKKFTKEYLKVIQKARRQRRVMLAFTIVFLLGGFFFPHFGIRMMLLTFAVAVFFTFYLWILIKAVEKSSMYKLVEPSLLTEGDWIAKEIKHAGKHVTGPKDLGVTKKQIAILKRLYKQKKIKRILVKEGIPFVPSFLFGWILTLFFGNILYLLF